MALKDMKEIEKIDRQRAIGDNMNGEERANKKLNSMMAKSNVKDAKYEIYKRALREDRVKEIFPKESIQSLRKMFDRYMKETGGRLK